MKIAIFYISFFLLFFVKDLYSQQELKVVFTDKAPSIDGLINEPAWESAVKVSDLIQREPETGSPVTEKTEFFLMIDRYNLYVGVKCYDDPEKISANQLARDVSLLDDDRIQILLDTFLDGRTAYWFQVGPRGSIADAIISENGKVQNKSWDGLWNGKARITSNGWEAEMAIPFKTLTFRKGSDTWGFKFVRYIRRKGESAYWPETSLNANNLQVSDAGRLTGINNITQGIGLDIVPYFTMGLSKKENDNADRVLDGGFDMFYQVNPSLKAAFTVNTDFAQTEVDEKQINLTRFNLYFPELRDFFLDGANFFSFGLKGDRGTTNTDMIPFFSRRIGLDSQGNPTTIKYGGKFIGKAGNWNIGFIHVKDDNKWNNNGYTVTRISRNFGDQSSIGFIGTNGNALSDNRNTLAGIDITLGSSKIRGNRNLSFNLYGVKTFTENYKDNDISFGTEISYPNDFLNFKTGIIQIGENFIPGLGFVPRKNIRNIYGNITLGPRPKNSPVLQIKSGLKYTIISDLKNNDIETAQVDLNYFNAIFKTGDNFSLSSQFQFESLETDFNIFDTIIIHPDDFSFWMHTIQVSTAKQRSLWGTVRFASGSFYSGKRTDLFIQTGYKIAIPLFLGLESDLRWVNIPEGRFLTEIYRLNFNILFSPTITWNNFAQYENKTKTIGWQSRFQWIIKPGKELFLTYNSPLIDPMEHFRPEIYEARIKIKYTIRF